MNELYLLIEELKKGLDQEQTIIELKKSYQEIIDNKELYALLHEYKDSYNDNLKKQILQFAEVRKAKHYESLLNYMILDINKELNKITCKKECFK